MKKVIFLHGGLGNQMFQYAFFLWLKRHFPNCLINVSLLDKDKNHNGYELYDVFGIPARKSLIETVILKLFLKLGFIRTVFRPILMTDEQVNDFSCLYNKHRYLYYGYWQNHKIVESVSDSIEKAFQFSYLTLPEDAQSYLKLIRETSSVSIHIRRGDYLKSGNAELYGGICTHDYYYSAIEYIKHKVPDATFFVFSDNIDEVAMDYFCPNCIYVKTNRASDAWIEMYLMANCKHNIIANSTFSWWGAWLNNNPHKIVISPSRFNNMEIKSALIPDTWVTIHV